MKKLFILTAIIFILNSTNVFADGNKNRKTKGFQSQTQPFADGLASRKNKTKSNKSGIQTNSTVQKPKQGIIGILVSL